MDDARFDAFSRSLGRLGPRRGLLKALAGLTAGALSMHLGGRPVSAISCRTVADCPEPPCQFVTCEGGNCVFTPAPGCCTEDAQCDDGDPCTRDTCDLSLNRCKHAPKAEEAPCGQGKVCRNGQCRLPCSRVQEPCTGHGLQSTCCQTEDLDRLLVCKPSPLGDKRCCRRPQDLCEVNSDCCGSETQTPACRNSRCCLKPGSACAGDHECCAGAFCRTTAGSSTGVCCQPDSKATTCNGRCGLIKNNCGQVVDCGCCPLRRVCQMASDCCQQFGRTECRTIHGSSQKGCCRVSGDSCGRNSECCGEGVCRGAAGNGRCCQPPQAPCGQNGDCCGAAVCRNGRCCENNSGASCTSKADCCGGLLCIFNICG